MRSPRALGSCWCSKSIPSAAVSVISCLLHHPGSFCQRSSCCSRERPGLIVLEVGRHHHLRACWYRWPEFLLPTLAQECHFSYLPWMPIRIWFVSSYHYLYLYHYLEIHHFDFRHGLIRLSHWAPGPGCFHEERYCDDLLIPVFALWWTNHRPYYQRSTLDCHIQRDHHHCPCFWLVSLRTLEYQPRNHFGTGSFPS